ncbi:MAG: hypothetical protein V1823_02700, partial [Chloroflexota bacterium]
PPLGDDLGGRYLGESAQIYVISSNNTLPEALDKWVNLKNIGKILEVDYSKYFVVIAANGYRGGIWSNFTIQRIIQRNDTISVVAHFNDRTEGYSLSAENSQYQVVKISRTQITQSGVITFRLLDEKGNERARVTSNLDK